MAVPERPAGVIVSPGEAEGTKLVARLARGEAAALGEFFDRYSSLAYGLAVRILRDPTEAEDVVQEVFVQAWRQAGRYDPGRGTPAAWVCTMARTRALDQVRRRTARREESAETGPQLAAPMPDSEEAMAVRNALAALSDDQRRALELAYYEGLTQSEIARRLDQPLGTVKTRIRTAMIRLRETLAGVLP
jgi:RNA polymerase sigma-70 factor (ECF subfamily)